MKRKILKLLVLVLLLLPLTRLQAQQITIKGVVSDKMGPLPMTNIKEVEGSNKTISDINGKFTIQAKVGHTLEFSYVGYKLLQHKVKASDAQLNIMLEEDAKMLNTVVVTALGIKRQEKALSYNTQSIKSEELTRAKDPNLVNSLSGKLAGVDIQSTSTGPGGAARVVMRGIKSIEGNNNALYVIDGIPMYNASSKAGSGRYSSRGTTEGIADINPEDVESITILTGASAAALYGSSAANGAILITTKKGGEGVLKVTLNSSNDFSRPFLMPRFQTSYDSPDGGSGSWGEKTVSPIKYTPKDFFRTPMTFTNSLTASLGSKKNQTFLSTAITTAQGLLPNNIYDRINLSARNTSSALNDKLKIDLGYQYIRQRDQNMVNQGEYMNPLVSAYLLPRSLDITDIKHFEQWDEDRELLTSSPFPEGEYSMQNPYWVAYRNLRTNVRNRYIVSLGANYELIKWSTSESWSIGTRYRKDHTKGEYKDKRYVGTLPTLMDGGDKNGYFGLNLTFDDQQYADIITNFNRNINPNLSLALNLGGAINDIKQYQVINAGPLRNDGLPNVFFVQNISQDTNKSVFTQEGWHEQTQSIFGSAEIGYKSMIYLTVTGRNDWASQLAGSNQSSFFYPSVGLSTVLTQLMSHNLREKTQGYLSYAKLRTSMAQVASPFMHGLTKPVNIFDENSKKWVKQGFYPLTDLKPERTNSFECGITSKWFDNHVNFDLTYYHTDTRNQTIRAEMSASSGYNYTYVQTGSVINQGIELLLGSDYKLGKKTNWSSIFTLGYNKNKINELVGNVQNPQNPGEPLFEKDELIKESFGNAQIILRPGGTLGDVYTRTDFVRNAEGIIDLSQDVKPMKEYAKLGSLLPKANMSWKNDFSWGIVNLGLMFSARVGGIVISGTEAALDYSGVSESSAKARDNGGVYLGEGVVAPAQNYYAVQGRPKDFLTQYYTYDASNVRLKEMYIGVNLSPIIAKHLLKINLGLVARNLWMIYCKAPFDPENIASTGNFTQGMDYFMLPSNTSIGINLKVEL